MFPVLLNHDLPLDAPPYTLFMSKLAITDNAAQMLQWKQIVSTCCENQFELVVLLSSPELTWSQVQHLTRIPEPKTCLLQQTMSITKYHRRLDKGKYPGSTALSIRSTANVTEIRLGRPRKWREKL
jgi:hypothetical protein